MIHLNLCASSQLLAVDKLTPEQKAELIFQLETSSKLDTNAITQIFGTFLQPFTNVTLNLSIASSDGLNKVRYECT